MPTPDLASMRPGSPTEVVELARRHLALEPPFVVARAKELEPDQDRRRDPAQLQALWQDLLQQAPHAPAERASAAVASPAAAPEADAPVPQPQDRPETAPGSEDRSEPPPEAAPLQPETLPPSAEADDGLAPTDFDEEVDDFDLAELHALDEAPSHAHDIEQKLKSAFPGTEFGLLPDPDDEAESET